MPKLTDDELLDLASDQEWEPGASVWLPRPGRFEQRCGSVKIIREDERADYKCHLVNSHPGYHTDVSQNVSWSPSFDFL